MSTDHNIAAGTLAGFRFNGKAELKHVNIRKDKDGVEDGEDGILTVDLTILASCSIDYLDPGIRAFLWSTEGIVRNNKIASLKIKSEVPDLAVEVAGVDFTSARAGGFIVEPLDSLKALVKFKLSAQPTSGEIAVLAEHHGEEIDLSIRSETVGLAE